MCFPAKIRCLVWERCSVHFQCLLWPRHDVLFGTDAMSCLARAHCSCFSGKIYSSSFSGKTRCLETTQCHALPGGDKWFCLGMINCPARKDKVSLRCPFPNLIDLTQGLISYSHVIYGWQKNTNKKMKNPRLVRGPIRKKWPRAKLTAVRLRDVVT